MYKQDIGKDELYISFQSGYFCIEDILATQIKISCTANTEIRGFGFLDPSLHKSNLPKGSSLELPVWAAQMMADPKREFVTPEIPSKYRKHYRDIIRAEPTILDLNKWGPYFYQSGIHVACLPLSERKAIRPILIFLFQKRMERLSLTYSYTIKLHSVNESNTYYRRANILHEHCMDKLEQRIYKDAQRGAVAFQTWMETPSRPLL